MGNMFRSVAGLLSIVLICLCISCGTETHEVSTPTATSATEDVARAVQLYGQREDLMRIREGIVSLRQAQTKDPGNYEAEWQLAKFNYYLATHTDDSTERDKAFRDGIEAGKAAVQLQNGQPDGHFWLGANYGGSAAHSTLSNLSSFQDIKGEMEAVLKLDEGYQGYSAYLGLGRLYLQAPKMLGGDPAKAVEYLEKGVKFNPNNTLMRYELAAAYETVNRNADAKKQIETLMSTTPDPKYVAEHKQAVEDAKKLLQKIDSES